MRAFLREESGPWKLSPAYDITHAHRPGSTWTARHLMSVNGRFEHITLEDLHALGARHDVPGYKQICRDTVAVCQDWPAHAARGEVPDDVSDAVAADISAFRPT